MDIRLVAIDLDGTLLNTEGEISKKNIEAIRKVKKSNIEVVICSGRIFRGARLYAKAVELDGPIIACNGAIIRELNGEATIHQELIEFEDCRQVIDLMHQQEIYFHAYVGDCMVTENLAFSSLKYYQKQQELDMEDRIDIKVVKNVKDYIQDVGKPVTKFVAVSDELSYLESVRKVVQKKVQGVGIVRSDKRNFEVMRQGVSKGKALAILAGKMGLKMNQVMAIGDNENDISMLEAAGFPVVMGNGWEEAKKLARFITKDNDDHGVAYALEEILL